MQFLAGVFLMPGCHMQFQFWWLALLPIALSMLGLPTLVTVWWPYVFYPLNNYHKMI